MAFIFTATTAERFEHYIPIHLTIYIIRVTLDTEFDTLWLSRVCAKTTCLNLMKPFAHESSLTSIVNDAPYNLTVQCFDPEKLK